MKTLALLVLILSLSACTRQGDSTAHSHAADAEADSSTHSAGTTIGDQLGTIRFEVSGNAIAVPHMQRGLKLMHHMMYSEADREFAAALTADPDCVLAYWGRAMTIIHPLWPDVPDEAQLKTGWDLVREGLARGPRTSRERAYLTALEAYYRDAANRAEPDRLAALDQAWARVAEEYPDDTDAACFAALFHLAPARFLPADKSHRIQLEAGAIVQKVLAEIPDHPGAQHYKIHAFDFPLLAGRALEVCDTYGTIAPDVPHALHMPTHIFTRLGHWEKSIDFNLRSAQAALKLGQEEGNINNHYPHALDYLVYAYLQTGQYQAAEKIRDEVSTLPGPYHASNQPAGAFAFSAIPARCALEQHRWAEAARLPLRQPASFPWGDRFAHYESILYFARSIGAARNGEADLARNNIEEHEKLSQQISAELPGSYWDVQGKSQLLSSRAWLAFAEGRQDDALQMMRDAADLEAGAEKEAVTPGEALPALELLGDLLAEMNRHQDALEAYEAVLANSPNRLNSLFGAARAAELAGDAGKAAHYYELLLDVTRNADSELDRLEHARVFLAAK